MFDGAILHLLEEEDLIVFDKKCICTGRLPVEMGSVSFPPPTLKCVVDSIFTLRSPMSMKLLWDEANLYVCLTLRNRSSIWTGLVVIMNRLSSLVLILEIS